MTNKEILKADILDILFEKRNKDYGAYALRRQYDKRLLSALIAAMGAILIFVFLVTFNRKSSLPVTTGKKENVVQLREVVLPKEKIKEPDKPKEQVKPKERSKAVEKKVAREKFTSKIEIKPDDKVKDPLPPVTAMDDKMISDTKEKGKPDDGIPQKKQEPVVVGNGNINGPTESVVEFKPQETSPEFPGGAEALKRFLASNLRAPSDLEEGEKKTVLIRFKVDKDGSVNTFEIVTSAGGEFDREVVRVCKRMPKWTPALQNGINVPVSYMLPVTFIGAEQ
ncbi:MAG: TonB family protein [Chitinophagaceae bacterium]|nr:TonB family protein [Chitinophagaceae bacterium]